MEDNAYKAAPGLPIYRYLDLSTAHTRPRELNTLLAATSQARGPRTIAHKYGAWVNVPTASESEAGETLEAILARCPHVAACLRYARQARCTWINFDADAEQIDGLEVFDWKQEGRGDSARDSETAP